MNKEIKISYFIICTILFMAIEAFLFFQLKDKADPMCKKAICNSDNSLCYVYEKNKNGQTFLRWKGSCQSNK